MAWSRSGVCKVVEVWPLGRASRALVWLHHPIPKQPVHLKAPGDFFDPSPYLDTFCACSSQSKMFQCRSEQITIQVTYMKSSTFFLDSFLNINPCE